MESREIWLSLRFTFKIFFMNWKQSLDKYLTTPPDNGFDDWVDDIIGNKISDKFYEEAIDCWLVGKVCNKWLNDLFHKGIEPEVAAKIIERAFYLYKL